jgi:hypothetical protein
MMRVAQSHGIKTRRNPRGRVDTWLVDVVDAGSVQVHYYNCLVIKSSLV